MEVEQNRRRSYTAYPSTHLADEGRWPTRTQHLLASSYALCAEGLRQPFRQCLADFDQLLFKQAERAKRPAEQQDCFASRHRLLHDGPAFEERFLQHLNAAFSGIDKGAAMAEAEAARGFAKPRVSLELLDPAEQERSMSIDKLGARGEMRHSSVLYELGYRLAVLVAMPPLDGMALPPGPHALARALDEASAPLELPLEHQLLLLQSFDQCVIQNMAPLYDSMNGMLQTQGILRQLRSISIPRQTQTRAKAAPADNATAAAPGNDTAKAGSGTAHGGSIEVLESLRDLLAKQRAGGQAAGAQPAGRAASEDELQLALSALQTHLVDVTDQASRELRSAQRLREELLAQLNAGKPADAPKTQLSSEQGDTVDLVAMLFEQLGQQLQGGTNANALLGNMQLPMLRMAVADKGFFEKQEHPARQLLDTVTAAAHDWLDGSDDESNRPLAAKLDQLVARANQEPPTAGLYTSLLADIEHHPGLLTRKAQAAERRHVEAALGRERLDQARRRAREFMAERFAQSSPRGLLRTLLDRAWSDVMALTLLRHGEDSDAFEAQLAITDQLLGRLPVTDRRQLQQSVELGLQQIGMHAEEAEQVAQRLLGTSDNDPAIDLPSATDLAVRLKQHQRLGETASQPSAAEIGGSTNHVDDTEKASTQNSVAIDPREQRIEKMLHELPPGSWFEFVDPATGQITQRKLAWHSALSGRCLLVSRRGQRGEEMTLAELAHEIAAGRVCEMPAQNESLLDRAWRNLTGRLRLPLGAARSSSSLPTNPSAGDRR